MIEQFAQQSADDDGLVLQPVIRNHSDWQSFTSGGLATARVVTARRPKGGIFPIGAALRMPTGNAVKDNFSAGGIASPIEVKTGQLGEATTAVPRNGRFELDSHPDTGHPLRGSELPKWDKLLNFVLDVHSHFKSIFVGWDVSYTTEGFQVIEGNLHWGTRLLEGSPLNIPPIRNCTMHGCAGLLARARARSNGLRGRKCSSWKVAVSDTDCRDWPALWG